MYETSLFLKSRYIFLQIWHFHVVCGLFFHLFFIFILLKMSLQKICETTNQLSLA